MSASRILRNKRRERHARVRVLLRPKLPRVLMQVWDEACFVWQFICEYMASPRELSLQPWIDRVRHATLRDHIRHLELLVRRLILAAALDLDIVLKPLRAHDPARPQKVRTRRRVLAWPERPETWIARLRMLPRKPPEDAPRRVLSVKRAQPAVLDAFPLARRLEAVRRVLLDPDARARRFAIKLARIKAANARANLPRLFRLRAWDQAGPPVTRGKGLIAEAMAIVHPIVCDQLDWWNDPEPG